MKTILLLAFKPFGSVIRGAVGLARGEGWLAHNAGQDVAQRLVASYAPDLQLEILPVDGSCEQQLAETLGRVRPRGVIALGEHLVLPPGGVHVEPYAVDAPPSALNQWSSGERVHSPFAEQVTACNDDTSAIGRFYCNRVYLTALRWAQADGRATPVVFVHVPVLGDRDDQAAQVLPLLARMRAQIGS